MVLIHEAIVTNAAPDGAPPGYIQVKIPDLTGNDEHPSLVAPLYPGWTAGGWHSVPQVTNPDGSDLPVRVLVIALTEYDLRWMGTSQGDTNITAAAADKVGARSPDGLNKVFLSNTSGFQVIVGAAPSNYITLSPDGVFQVGTATGEVLSMSEDFVSVVNGSGDALVLDASNGIVLAHNGGAELLAIESGLVKLMGTDVQLFGGSATITGQGGVVITDDPLGLAATEKAPMAESSYGQLSNALTELKAALNALGLPTVQTDLWIATEAAGTYYSTVLEWA